MQDHDIVEEAQALLNMKYETNPNALKMVMCGLIAEIKCLRAEVTSKQEHLNATIEQVAAVNAENEQLSVLLPNQEEWTALGVAYRIAEVNLGYLERQTLTDWMAQLASASASTLPSTVPLDVVIQRLRVDYDVAVYTFTKSKWGSPECAHAAKQCIDIRARLRLLGAEDPVTTTQTEDV